MNVYVHTATDDDRCTYVTKVTQTFVPGEGWERRDFGGELSWVNYGDGYDPEGYAYRVVTLTEVEDE